MKQLTDALAKIQHVLQKGNQLVDLAIYRHSYQENLDVCGAEKQFNSSNLEQLGYSYDFVSPAHFIDQDTSFDGKYIFSDGPCYKAIIFDNQFDLPHPFAKKLAELGKQGLPIIFVGDMPSEASFFGEDSINDYINELKACKNVFYCDNIEQLPEVLKQISVLPYVAYDEPQKILNVYRKTENTDYVYFYNYADADTYYELTDGKRATFTATINSNGTPYILDPWTDNISEAEIISKGNGTVTIALSLATNNSIIVAVSNERDTRLLDTVAKKRITLVENSFEVTNWTLEVESWTAGENAVKTKKEIVKKIKLEEPIFFTKINGLNAISGVGYYSANFYLKDDYKQGAGAYIKANKIEDCYVLEVNGNVVPANQVEPLIDIGKYVKKGKNTVKFTVYSTLLNATIDYCNKQNINNNGQFEDYGLDGPVKIIPYTIK